VDLELTDDQSALVDAFGGFFEKECPPSTVRRAEPLGHDPALWHKAVELGVPMMATAESVGGGGASMSDLGLVAELVGRHLAPIPFVETSIAARLLARADARGPLARAHGGEVITFAVRPAVEGVARLVPAGAIASGVVAAVDGALVLVTGDAPAMANMASMPWADRPVAGDVEVIARGDEATRLRHLAVTDWQVLAASVLSGIATRALEIGTAYAKQREQFDKPLAAFQSIAHRLADDATDVQGLQLLARKAAWAVDHDPASADRLSAMAYLWGGEIANRVTGNSLHVHGGYGFMLEYDIQLHYRRAKAWSVVAGDPRAGYAQLGTELFGSRR
jgi:alkylation response protein AidB-like acyl-CoA dehydrogenase